MKKRGVISIMFLCLLLTGVTACGGGDEDITPQLPVEEDITVIGDGELSIPNRQELTFGTYGRIAVINVVEGDEVVQGQVLAVLDTLALERDLEAAQQAVKTAELAVQTAEINRDIAADNYKKLTYPYNYHTFAIDMPTASSLNKDALADIQEIMALMKETELTDAQYRDVMEKLKRVQNNLDESLDYLVPGSGSASFELGLLSVSDYWTIRAAQLQADIAQVAVDKAYNDLSIVKASLAGVQDRMENTVVTAPFDGTIALVDAQEGEYLTAATYAGQTIIEIVDLTQMELVARVSELDIAGVKAGQRVIISVDALPEVEIEGQVVYIPPLARDTGAVLFEDDDEESEYEVKIRFDIPANLPVRAGMSATAEVFIE